MDEDESIAGVFQKILLKLYQDTDIVIETIYVEWVEGQPIATVHANVGSVEV